MFRSRKEWGREMKTTIIPIGNSRGIRIPKPLLEESGLLNDVEIYAKKGEIKITAAKPTRKIADTTLLSNKALAKDWLRQEEDEAWADL